MPCCNESERRKRYTLRDDVEIGEVEIGEVEIGEVEIGFEKEAEERRDEGQKERSKISDVTEHQSTAPNVIELFHIWGYRPGHGKEKEVVAACYPKEPKYLTSSRDTWDGHLRQEADLVEETVQIGTTTSCVGSIMVMGISLQENGNVQA
ncbi:hypothetical protein N7497_011382 [Penicillium chrysogenum]|nr:hypothetical protein N7497_011382 [Penicillium chrysogenum]